MKKTKIVATIGPASDSREVLAEIMKRGLNVARLNFSHGSHPEHLARMETIKAVREELELPVAIMLDTKGPEIRTRDFAEKEVILEDGQDYTVTTRDIVGDKTICSVTYEHLADDVKIGDRILIDDGLIELEIVKIEGTEIRCKVKNGGPVSNHKGVNIPMVNINLPAVTERDVSDIKFGIAQEVDFIAASFVRKAQDVLDIRKVLEENHGTDIHIISKIENHEGVENIDQIIEVSDGIMVARGDLGVEIPPEDVPMVQKHIIKKCNEAGKPVITATQMLDSMIRNPRPTRAEVTDVANAILDGTDAIMLSGETAMGKYPVEAVTTMKNIAIKTEDSMNYKRILKEKSIQQDSSITDAISFSACATAQNLGAKAILSPTASGYTPIVVSSFRPKSPIIAATESKKVFRRLSLVWGVYPVIATESDATDDLIEHSIDASIDNGFIGDGDLIVITTGIPVGVAGSTNMIKVQRVGESILKGTGIGRAPIDGRVCNISTLEDFKNKFRPGDIVVAMSVEKPMVKYLEKASGLITEEGGYTSNGAIVALNIGIPVIVGVEDAKLRLEDDEVIRLDPLKGLIYKNSIKV